MGGREVGLRRENRDEPGAWAQAPDGMAKLRWWAQWMRWKWSHSSGLNGPSTGWWGNGPAARCHRLMASRSDSAAVWPSAPSGGIRAGEGISMPSGKRPERKNPLTFDSYAELRDLFRALAYSSEVRAVVITGANQGLGLAMARAYVEAGASLCICARDQAKLKAAADELRALASAGQRVVAVAADVSEVADVGRVAAAAFDVFERIHVLVCNAGVYGPMGPSEDVDWDAWSRAVRINIDASSRPLAAKRALVTATSHEGHAVALVLSLN